MQMAMPGSKTTRSRTTSSKALGTTTISSKTTGSQEYPGKDHTIKNLQITAHQNIKKHDDLDNSVNCKK